MTFPTNSLSLEDSSDLIVALMIGPYIKSRLDGVVVEAFACGHVASLDELRNILDLILPVLEGQVDVVAHLLDHCLHGCRLAHHLHLLTPQIPNPALYALHLTPISLLLVLSVEADQYFEHFVVAQTEGLL